MTTIVLDSYIIQISDGLSRVNFPLDTWTKRVYISGMKKKQIKIRFNLGGFLAAQGMTQREAARLTGISKNAISVLAGEPQQIQFDTLAKLCAGLDVTPEKLIVLEEVK
jgi:DNA-binding Xre family transcriptional regulator